MIVNLYFWKVDILRYPYSAGNELNVVIERDYTVLELGRYEMYIIPRNSNQF